MSVYSNFIEVFIFVINHVTLCNLSDEIPQHLPFLAQFKRLDSHKVSYPNITEQNVMYIAPPVFTEDIIFIANRVLF